MQKSSVERLFSRTLIDVRSPCEFNHGHIPTALNLPLFTDEERKIVGTTYKQSGKRTAIEEGLKLINLHKMVQRVRQLELPSSFDIYCARGGMRSSSIAWLLELLGYEPFVVEGGYKSFRKWALEQFAQPYSLLILGGETGSGKTKIIKALEKRGENIIDLEHLAAHRGSVFGSLGQQPTQEQFENELALQLFQKKDKEILVENESQRIGRLSIPGSLFEQMKCAPAFVLQVPQEKRLQECLDEYLALGSQKLSAAVLCLKKRLGSLETKRALEALEQNNFHECCRILLRYYDKKYHYGMTQRDPKILTTLPSALVADDTIINKIQNYLQ